MLPRRVLAPLAGVVLALALLPWSRGLDSLAREGQLGPGFWPRLALSGLALACLAKAREEWRLARGQARETVRARPEISRPALLGGIALVIGYVLLASPLGFALTTGLFIAAFMALSGARAPVTIALSAALGTVGLLYVFVKAVYLPLPKGDGPFEALTLALYRALGLF